MAVARLRWIEALYVLGLTLLVGAQLAVGYLVAPTLFAVVPERALAGTLAGEIFARLGWIAFTLLPLLFLLQRQLWAAAGAPVAVRWRLLLPTMWVLTCIGHLGLRPWIARVRSEIQALGGFEVCPPELRARFGMLHGASSLVFMLVSVLGLLLLWRLRERSADAD